MQLLSGAERAGGLMRPPDNGHMLPPLWASCGMCVCVCVCDGWRTAIRPLCVWEAPPPLHRAYIHLFLAAGVDGTNGYDQPAMTP